MSRDFKQEYEQHMNEQTPDLWARIEANLPVKEVPTVKETVVSDLEAMSVATEDSNIRPMKQRKGISRRWTTYGMTAAAALLICFLAVPVLRSAQGGQSESANFMAKDAAMPEMIMEDGVSGTGTMDNGMTYGADGDTSEMMEQEAECEAEEMITEDYVVVEGINDSAKTEATGGTSAITETEKAVTTESAATPVRDAEESKQATFVAKVTILEMFEQDGKVCYRADIAGEEVILILGELLSGDVSIAVSKTYELSLETADEDATWDYVIVGIE